MKKTFFVGIIGFFLVGGFVTGLYLINQPTNPETSASEIINPIPSPRDLSRNGESVPGLIVPTAATSSGSLAVCQNLTGLASQDQNYNASCDIDKNGIINVIDLSKMR